MSFKIYIDQFPNYDNNPDQGKRKHDDSKIIELEFTINNIDYFAKIHVDISYNRWYYRETYSNPMEDEVELVSKEITIIKIVKFINGDEVKLKSKENKKIENCIIENIEIC